MTSRRMHSYDPSLLQTFRGHQDAVTDADISPDQTKAVSASLDNYIMLWTLQPHLRAFRFGGHTV